MLPGQYCTLLQFRNRDLGPGIQSRNVTGPQIVDDKIRRGELYPVRVQADGFLTGSQVVVVDEKGEPVTIQGGRTGLAGAAVPLGGLTLNLERMNQLLYMRYTESERLYSIAAEAGVLLEDLVHAVLNKSLDSIKGKGSAEEEKALEQFIAEEKDYTFPVDPTEMSAWIGGITACNASGAGPPR